MRTYGFLALVLLTPGAFAFDWVNKKTTYLENHALTFNLSMGTAALTGDQRIGSDNGFTLHVGVGQQFSQWLQGELFYQFSFFDLRSPDPLNSSQFLDTGADVHETGLRFLVFYPAVAIKPYLGFGVGGYQLDHARDLALQYDMELQVPLSAGLRMYMWKDILSLELDFTYRILFGQEQPADVRTLLNLKDTSFNLYSVTAGVQFHIF